MAPRRRGLGLRRARAPGVPLLLRRQPGPRAGRARRGPRLRRPGPPAGPALLVARRRQRRGRPALVAAGAHLGTGPRRPARPAADGARRGRRRSSRTRPCAGSARTRSTSCCPPASRCSPRRSASRRCRATAARSTAPGSRSWCSSSAPTPGSRAARCCSRPRSGAATSQVCQVQGVWVHPAVRGRGLSVSGVAAVVELARSQVAPVVSLYVNEYNAPARRSYERVGFQTVGTFTSVLF